MWLQVNMGFDGIYLVAFSVLAGPEDANKDCPASMKVVQHANEQ